MIERAIAAEAPFMWVAADSVYGVGEIETALRRAGKGYVLGVNATHPFNSWAGKPAVAGTAEAIAADLDPAAWRRLSAGEGAKGPRLYDWADLELADLEAAEYEDGRAGLWTRGLLVRRSVAGGECAYFTTWCLAGTAIETLVKVEGRRWAIEGAFETAKTELGLDHDETRSWHGWHRHVSLVMLAFAMLAVIRQHANTAAPPKITRCAGFRAGRWLRVPRWRRPVPRDGTVEARGGHGPGDPYRRRVLPRGRLRPRPLPRSQAAPARPGAGPRRQRGAHGRDRRRVPRPRHRPGPARLLPAPLRPPVPAFAGGPPHHLRTPGGQPVGGQARALATARRDGGTRSRGDA